MSKKRLGFLGALLVVILVGGLLVWWSRTVTNEDPLWFLRSFTAEADWIVVYWDGAIHRYFPGDQAYEEIMAAFSDAIAHWRGYESGIRFSQEGLEQVRQQERLLELHYNEPVQVHTHHLFPEVCNFYVPLSGAHSHRQRIFAGLSDEPGDDVLTMSDARFAALLEVVSQVVR